VSKLLRSVKCGSSIFPSPLSIPIAVSTEDTVSTAFKTMIDNEILAVPVIQEDTGGVISVFSMLDVLSQIVNHFSETDILGLLVPDTETWQYFYSKLLGTKDQVTNERLDKLFEKRMFEFEELDPVYTVYSDFPLENALELMIGSKAHRVVVLDRETGQFSNFITQSRVLELLNDVLPEVPEYNQPIGGLLFWQNPLKHIETVQEDELVFKAFKDMARKQVSGLAVLNQKGELVGSISVSDLKLLEFDFTFFAMLGNSVKEYLKNVANPELLYEKPVRFKALREALAVLPKPVVTCTLTDTVLALWPV